MSPFSRGICIPLRPAVTYIMSRISRVIRSRVVSMELSYITAAISLLAEHIADAYRIFLQATLRSFSHAIERDAVSFRIHSCQEDASVRAT